MPVTHALFGAAATVSPAISMDTDAQANVDVSSHLDPGDHHGTAPVLQRDRFADFDFSNQSGFATYNGSSHAAGTSNYDCPSTFPDAE